MKSAGAIYRQYRQIRKLALLRSLSAARQKVHENCHYGRSLQYQDVDGHNKSVKLCLLKPSDPDVCTNARDCNAFARRWSDEMVAERFSNVMDDESSRKRLFPELWAYEWVLDKSLTEAYKSTGWLSRSTVWAISVLEGVLKALNGRRSLLGHGGRDAKD
jgi:hypothetical protein